MAESALGPGGPPYPYLPLRFTKITKFLKIRSAISTPNGRISEISINSTFPEIRAGASGSRPTRQNLSPDLRIWARAGRAAISIPTHVFYGNHGIPENRVGYIHSKWKDFRDFHKFQLSGNPSTSLRISPHASESEPRPQNLGSENVYNHHYHQRIVLYTYKEIVSTFLKLPACAKMHFSESSATMKHQSNSTALRAIALQKE